jgi:hypothetical protein
VTIDWSGCGDVDQSLDIEVLTALARTLAREGKPSALALFEVVSFNDVSTSQLVHAL